MGGKQVAGNEQSEVLVNPDLDKLQPTIKEMYEDIVKNKSKAKFKVKDPKQAEAKAAQKKFEDAKKKAMMTYGIAEQFVSQHVCDNTYRDKLLFELNKIKVDIEAATIKEKIPSDIALRKMLYNAIFYYV